MNLPAIANLSSSFWAQFGAPLGNHLWQSTVFAGVVWSLTFFLRKNRAETRYSLWLVASAKFLLPFSLLIGLGSHIAKPKAPVTPPPSLLVVTQVLSEPFDTGYPAPVAHASDSPLAALLRALPTLLLMVWFCGCSAVLFFWWKRRRRMTAAKHDSSVVQAGRELETLRRLERSARMAGPIELRISESTVEPGILGIFRPVLLLPTGISDRLTDAQLQAIITHELCHVRRRDNLAATLHMLVEAVFWFHPLVWWIGARLVDERERACDEEVLKLGSDPQAYAEGILKVCEFYVESPLFCAAGVTGWNLKKRIEAIMTHRTAYKLEAGKKLLLAAVGLAAVTVPIAIGLAHPTPVPIRLQAQGADALVPEYQVISLKPNKSGKTIDTLILFRPNGFTATNFTLRGLICEAYGVQDSQISGGPDWLNSEKYDIEANVDGSVAEAVSNFPVEHQRIMLQHLLSDQFKLSLHYETRDLPAYELVVAKDGPKLSETNPGGTSRTSNKNPERKGRTPGLFFSGSRVTGEAVSPAALVEPLSRVLGRPVLDKTGLKGEYDFTLDWFAPLRAPESAPALLKAASEHAEALAKVHAIEAASILMAVSEQLGLELNPPISPVETLVIDHAEKITSNESSQTQPQDQSVAGSAAASIPRARVYEAVSIRPNQSTSGLTPFVEFRPDGFTATNVTSQMLTQQAYGVEAYQIAGAPAWLDRDRYDVEAKVDDSLADELSKGEADRLSAEQQPMLFELLADHFLLSVHRETRELPAYALVIAKNGSKLHDATPGDTYPNGIRDSLGNGHDDIMRMLRGQIIGQGISLAALVQPLSHELGRTVLNRTGLTGKYDFTLQWSDGRILARQYIVPGVDSRHVRLDPPPSTNTESGEFSGPSIFAALHDQLGLELVESHEQSSPAQILVIDRAEKPSGN